MIWFDIKQLEAKLRDGDFSDKEGFNYLLALSILSSMVSLPTYITTDHHQNDWLTYVQLVIDIFITVLMLRATFDINTNGDNKDYFKRFLSLLFITMIRLIVYLFIPVGLFILFEKKSNALDKNLKDIIMALLGVITEIIGYFMLTNSFKRINEKRE